MKEVCPFRLDAGNQCLWQGNQRIHLPPKAFALLAYLVKHSGKLVTHTELKEVLWPDTFVQPAVLKTHIRDLRTALGDNARNPRFIQTHHRCGYRFIGPIHGADGPTKESWWGPAPSIVGREKELEVLQGIYKDACAGKPQVVFVTGEPGIGKSTLARAMGHEILQRGTGAKVVLGQCIEGYAAREPYYSLLEAVSNLLRLPGSESIVELLALRAPTWLVRLPSHIGLPHREMLSREVTAATTERMLREFCEAMTAVAAERPLVIVLEDVQWADLFTVDCISALARGRRTTKLMVVATCRPADLAGSRHPLRVLKQRLVTRGLCREVALNLLTKPQVQQLLETKSSNLAVPPGLTDLIWQNSEGNPLFIEAILHKLIAQGILSMEDGNLSIKSSLTEHSLVVPDSLGQSIQFYIDSILSPPEQRLLEAASVCGVSFLAATAATAARTPVEKAEEVFDRLARSGDVIRSQGLSILPDGSNSSQYAFVHSLYREVLYRRIAPIRLSKLHRTVSLLL